MRPAQLVLALVLAIIAAACRVDGGDLDDIFYDGDGRLVHCAVNLDSSAGNTLESLDHALDRAAARGEVVELYAHRPGVTVPLATIEHVLAGAVARGLPFVTYRDFAAGGGTGPGLALSFDDEDVADWLSARPLLLQHGARVTFFVTRYHKLDEVARAQLRELAADGHDIAAHSVNHLRAPAYVEERGLAAFMAEEVLPSIEVLRAEGYEVTSYAFPFGARTAEIDRAVAAHVPVLRSVEFPIGGPFSPCPR
ncbi:MAG TPA: polysaccharide deacetylase family protein [Kofleriaceae bacterium]|nr:polysaccharide deacetylase family protein [Kofleriaceae bacterium]